MSKCGRRLLALHGYSQNVEIFHEKTSTVRKILLKDDIEIVYAEAPWVLDQDQIHGQNNDGKTLRGWWSFSDINDIESQLSGVSESVDKICKKIEDEAPFEGILGFSQGGCLAGLLCAMNAIKPIPSFENIKYAVFAGTHLPIQFTQTHFAPFLGTKSKKIDIPSLHIHGTTDTLVPMQRVVEFSDMFADAALLEHPGGHFIPSRSKAARELLAFINNAQKSPGVWVNKE